MRTSEIGAAKPAEAAHEYARLLVRLANLHRIAPETEEEQEQLCDIMDYYWYAMTPAEIARLRGLSADLHLIDPHKRPSYQEPPLQQQTEIQTFFSQWASKDWDERRNFLRTHEAEIPPDRLLYGLSRLWDVRGFPEAALAFAAEAQRLRPDEVNPKLHLVVLLWELGRRDEAAALAEECLAGYELKEEKQTYLLSLLVAALPPEQAAERGYVEALEQRAAEPERCGQYYLSTLMILANFFARERQQEKSERYQQAALDLAPEDPMVLGNVGILRVHNAPKEAWEYLERAVALGATEPWPYLVLAQHALRSSAFETAKDLCEQGLRYSRDPRVEARFNEFLALCGIALNAPRHEIMLRFEQAHELAPMDVSIQRNRRAYENMLAGTEGDGPQPMPDTEFAAMLDKDYRPPLPAAA